MNLVLFGINAVEHGLVPDALVRAAIRQFCRERLRRCDQGSHFANQKLFQEFVVSTHSAPIAPVPEKANEQHYELPPEFFACVLGPHRKYSACYWTNATKSLGEAEAAALEITCQRAELSDGQRILELGCGWGSLSLWIADHFRNSHITAVSNSAPQRMFIEEQAVARGLSNLRVITVDMNQFEAEREDYDRVVSVEMFEHMRNFECLLARIACWLKPDGKLFVHHFCQERFAYAFESHGEDDWIGRHFFTEGVMPSENLLRAYSRDLTVSKHWAWNGTHYQRTSEAWLANLDAKRSEIMPILAAVYGKYAARLWFHRWRVFFLAVAELFGFAKGKEWFVSHSLLERTEQSQ